MRIREGPRCRGRREREPPTLTWKRWWEGARREAGTHTPRVALKDALYREARGERNTGEGAAKQRKTKGGTQGNKGVATPVRTI
eukprot:scaffold163366_cov26-Tisochrysis_lutea.AAC.1